MNQGNEEAHIYKLLCPEGHSDVHVCLGGGFTCDTCVKNYTYEELTKVPISHSSSYHPTVYGHLN